MKRILCSALALSISLFVAQCSQLQSVGPVAHGETKSVKVAIKVAPAFDTIAAKAVAVVSAPDMQPITTTLGLDGDTLLTGIISNIPIGASRFFEVFVYGFDGGTEYYGCANADISSRDTTYVTIVLRKPYGTAVIGGYIEELQPGEDHLSAVTIPYIAKTWNDDSSGSPVAGIEFATTPVYSKIAFDTILYSWAIVELSPDTVYQNVVTTMPSLSFYFYKDGRYEVMVKASCMKHAYGKTSGPMYFWVSNGNVYPDGDTVVIPPIDTFPPDTMPEFRDLTPPVISFPWANPVTIGILDTLDYSQITAYDAWDGDVSDRVEIIGDIIYSVPGTQYLDMRASDRSGNIDTLRLEVKITRRQHESFQQVPVNYPMIMK